MFCLGATMYSDVICSSDTSLAFFEDLIHFCLKDVLGTDQDKGKVAGNGIFQKGVLKVISKLESWLRMIDQYPWWVSNLLKKQECVNL